MAPPDDEWSPRIVSMRLVFPAKPLEEPMRPSLPLVLALACASALVLAAAGAARPAVTDACLKAGDTRVHM
jgi:hypothetical protein